MINVQEEISKVLSTGIPCTCGGTITLSFTVKDGKPVQVLVCKKCGLVMD